MKTLAKRLKGAAKQSAYSVYLQHELIKCHLELNDLVEMIPLAKRMYSDARALGSIAWQVNALMMAVLSESRLGDVSNCVKTLELIVPLGRSLGNENVTGFLRKVSLHAFGRAARQSPLVVRKMYKKNLGQNSGVI